MVKVLLDNVASRIHKYVSVQFSASSVRLIAFVVALVACLSAGSITLFSLFTASLSDAAGLSYFQINTIASCSALGMYLCLPVLGYLGDCYGPGLLALILVIFFCPSYVICALLYHSCANDPAPTYVYVYGFGAAFACIGLATSSLFFSSLIACAKIYPLHKGLAISLPVTCFGLSTLTGAQLMKLEYFSSSLGRLDLQKVFVFFAIVYFFVGALNFVASSLVMVELDVVFSNSCSTSPEDLVDEQSSLLPYSSQESDGRSLRTQRSIIEPPNHRERYIRFLKDPSARILLLALILCLGPLESYQNNLGSMIENVSRIKGAIPPDLSDNMSAMALASVVTRILIGVFSDYLSSPQRSYPIGSMWIVMALLACGICGQLGNNYLTANNLKYYSALSSLNGIYYGGLFTTFPTIVASIWGIDMVGTTWGSFMIAPAIGSVVFSLIYGHQVDAKCSAPLPVHQVSTSCLSVYFSLTSLSIALALALVVFTWRVFWCKRGLGSL